MLDTLAEAKILIGQLRRHQKHGGPPLTRQPFANAEDWASK
jgi:hypothetical protein